MWSRRRGPVVLTIVAVCGAAFTGAFAAPPLDPLPDPLYSFGVDSVKVQNGIVGASDLLEVGFPDPITVITGAALGFPNAGDDLNGLSSNNAGFAVDQPFAVLFSVDESTQGNAVPIPILENLEIPFNVQDQAIKGQQAGDQYMSLRLADRLGILPPNGIAAVGDNNTLVKNNYDEGGTDFGANPETSASSTSNDPQDNLDGTKKDEGTGSVAGGANGPNIGPGTYYCASNGSPSLQKVSGTLGIAPSGANIFYNANPRDGTNPIQLFAAFVDLGLQQGDDINGMIVFDDNGDGEFNGTDQVLFSLAPGSPSLPFPGGSSIAPGADIYTVSAAAGAGPIRFIGAQELGLGSPGDNIDALDFVPCDDVLACARDFAIRRGAVPTVSDWGAVLMGLLLVVGATILYRRSATPTAA